MIKIIQPNENDNGYKYEFIINGQKGTGYLTYDLMDNLKTRTLLLTRKTNIINDEKVARSFEALQDQIQLYKNKGSFFTAKEIVNSIYDKEFNIPHVSVAVHKYGPVPVCVIPEVFDVEFNGEIRQCRVGIYPYIKKKGSSDNLYGVQMTKIGFLQALKIRLDVMLKRYLEDVGENLFDIENHSDLSAAIKKAKASETVLAESITSKIDLILSTTKGHANQTFYQISNLKNQLIKSYTETIFKARYAKFYAYFFINELYKSTGFSSKDFKTKFRKLKTEEADYNATIINDTDLILLRKAITHYEIGKGRNILEENLAGQTSTLWVKRFIQFASFIHYLKKENKNNPHITKIFLSSRFTKSNSQVLKTKLDTLINNYFTNRIQLLAVQENSAGNYVNELVKSRIWLSSATYSAIPNKNVGSLNTNFDWIAKEAIYSESLKNKLLFILNKKQGDSLIHDFKEYLVNTKSYLAPEARNIKESKDSIVQKIHHKLHARYDTETMDDLVFDRSLIKDIETLMELKVIHIIEAWLNQFSDEVATTILDMNLKLVYPSRISKATNLVFGKKIESSLAKRKFRRAWVLIKKRKLIIDGKEYPLVVASGKANATTYKQNLPAIIKALTGDEKKVASLLKRCYKLRSF